MALRLTFAAAALMMSGAAFSAVTITAPEEIKILAVNDQEVNTGLFRSANNQYKVDAGESLISVRYTEYFEHLNGEHDIVKSGVVTLKIPLLKEGENYRLDLVNAPASFEAAKKYAEQPVIALMDNNKQILVQQSGANTEQKPWLGQGIFAKATDLTQKKSTPVNQPAPVYTQAAVISGAALPASLNSSVSTHSANTADQQLIQLWKNSNKAERQKFMAWLAEQAN
ncbi:DUF2057 domain-containing protein [Acinetobacter terrestris]|uniref:DUF2057 domain-containing protein n=1 Tax=Acinetobacter terrestris TaxID=2529843 RepID=A0ABX1UXL8_9GAMM|nr:DUF2057 domain-containing protein [Acinetobacter terrestris]NNH27381.1 DUF2057 domain-containing protein [Acinetobacter terrestris]